MLKVDLYSFEGKKKENITLPKEYDVKPNLYLLSQAVHVYEDRGHLGLARAKTRSEVAISTRKIYRQKGTGGARHGAKSAPIFVGGGVAHGPKGIKRILHLSGSQKEKAFLYAFSYKVSESGVVLVEGLEKIKKTKDAFNLIKNIIKDKNLKSVRNITIAFSEKNNGMFQFFRNIEGVNIDYFKNLNAYKVYLANVLVIDKAVLEEKTAKKVDIKEKIESLKVNKKVSISRKRVTSKSIKGIKVKKAGRVVKK
jgi:large subunit ribosomal protein L4